MRGLERRVERLEGGPRRGCSLCAIEHELVALHDTAPPPLDQTCPHHGATYADLLRTLNEDLGRPLDAFTFDEAGGAG